MRERSKQCVVVQVREAAGSIVHRAHVGRQLLHIAHPPRPKPLLHTHPGSVLHCTATVPPHCYRLHRSMPVTAGMGSPAEAFHVLEALEVQAQHGGQPRQPHALLWGEGEGGTVWYGGSHAGVRPACPHLRA